MFYTEEEMKTQAVIRERESKFPQFTGESFWILRKDVKAFNKDGQAGVLSLDGKKGLLLRFDCFCADGKAHFIEPILKYHEHDGSFSCHDSVCYHQANVSLDDEIAVSFEKFDFAKSKFNVTDAVIKQIYNQYRCKLLYKIGWALSLPCTESYHEYLMEKLGENRRFSNAESSHIASVKKYAETLGIDPHIERHKGCLSVPLSQCY